MAACFLFCLIWCLMALSVELSQYNASLMMKTVFEGDKVIFPCRTTLRDVSVTWTYQKENQESVVFEWNHLAYAYRTTFNETLVNVSVGDYSLVLNNATKNYSGVYICAENAGIGDRHNVTINVIGVPSESWPNTKNEIAVVGAEFTLPCLSTSSHAVTWRYKNCSSCVYDLLYDGRNVITQYKKSVSDKYVNQSAGNFSLALISVTAENSGLYVCIENENPSNIDAINITVKGEDTTADDSWTTRGVKIATIVAVVIVACVASIIILVVVFLLKRLHHSRQEKTNVVPLIGSRGKLTNYVATDSDFGNKFGQNKPSESCGLDAVREEIPESPSSLHDAPSPPQNLLADRKGRKCTLHWRKPHHPPGVIDFQYIVEVSKTSRGTKEWEEYKQVVITDETKCQRDDLDDGCDYKYRVVACNEFRQSKPSESCEAIQR